MKKAYKIVLSILLVAVTQFQNTSIYGQEIPLQNLKFINDDNQVYPQKDIIKWVYKKFNGKLYKRQYNLTTLEWVGGWQLVV